MGTKKESRPVIKQEYIVTDWDKEEKKGGQVITLTDPHKPIGQTKLLPGTTLTECNDGYFKVENQEGEKMHYRIGKIQQHACQK